MQESRKSPLQLPTSQELIDQYKKNLADEGAERAILASLMKEPEKMIDSSSILTAQDFTNENNAYLYEIMLSLFKRNGGKNCRFDIATLQIMAKDKGVEQKFLERSGGEEYIGFLNIVKDSWIDIASFDFYVNKVYSLSLRRKLLDNSRSFQDRIGNLDKSPDELMVQEQSTLNDILVNANGNNEIRNLASKTTEMLEDALTNKKEIIGIRTLFPRLDNTIEGLRRGNLIIVSAPKKTGKSAFLMNVGLNVAVKQNIPTLMISTEMTDSEIMFRALASLSGIQEKKIIKGNLDHKELEVVFAARKKLEDGKFYHVEMRGFSLEKIIATVRKFVNNIVGYGPDGKAKDCLVIFDYIKLPQGGSAGGVNIKDAKEYKILGLIADGMKIIAGDLDIPFLTACQTNRGGDVANSYELTWFCNTFMELKKKSPQDMDRDLAEGNYLGNQVLKIVANRGGEENHEGIPLDYAGEIIRYNEVQPPQTEANRAREVMKIVASGRKPII